MSSEKAYRQLESKVDFILGAVARLVERQEASLSNIEVNLMGVVDDLKKEVAKNRDVTASAVQLLQELTGKLQSAISNEDLGELQRIVDEVKADSQVLGDAVAANTIAAPTPPAPEPVPAPPIEPAPSDPSPT
jgi:septation ring formation regulator EzrA